MKFCLFFKPVDFLISSCKVEIILNFVWEFLMNKKLYPRLFFSLMALLVVSGCTARIDHRGKLPDPEQIAKIKPGVQDKEEVLRLIGSPSTIAVFDENTTLLRTCSCITFPTLSMGVKFGLYVGKK